MSPRARSACRPRPIWAALILLAIAATAHAEWPYDDDDGGWGRKRPGPTIAFGPRGGYDYDGDAYSAGAQLLLPIPLGRTRPVTLAPSADVYNDGSGADWQANLDLLMSAGPGLYLGIGLAWVEERNHRTREINQLVGLRLPGSPRGRARPYLEARWTELNRDNAFRLVVGVSLSLWPR